MPRLMGNWDHLLVRNQFADEAVQVMQHFQERLRELSLQIDKRNNSANNSGDHHHDQRSKRRRFAMQAFNPVNMESSVSV